MKNKYTLFLIFTMAIWGGSWTAGKLVTNSASPEVVSFWRYLITAISLAPFIRKRIIKVSVKNICGLFVVGVIIVLYNICFLSGLRYGQAGAGGVLVTTIIPIFTFLLTMIFFQWKIKLIQMFALTLGFIGGLTMLKIWNLSWSELLKSGNGFFLLASMLWAFLNILSSSLQKEINFMVYAFYVSFFATIVSFILSLCTGKIVSVPTNYAFWFNLFYISLGATSIGTTIYFFCISRLGTRKASAFILTVPLFAVLFSSLFLNEVPAYHTIIGGAISLIAVYLINKYKYEKLSDNIKVEEVDKQHILKNNNMLYRKAQQ